jgi:hypothetical protein
MVSNSGPRVKIKWRTALLGEMGSVASLRSSNSSWNRLKYASIVSDGKRFKVPQNSLVLAAITSGTFYVYMFAREPEVNINH